MENKINERTNVAGEHHLFQPLGPADMVDCIPKRVVMSTRNSSYARIGGDTYVTPDWVFEALFSVENFGTAWDPAPINFKHDFLSIQEMPGMMTDIVTNPPFSLSEAFVRRGIELVRPHGKAAFLLPHTWDTAKRRTDLFVSHPFKIKYAITKRIRWDNLQQKKNGPSTNHSWYVWDWEFDGEPTMGWLP